MKFFKKSVPYLLAFMMLFTFVFAAPSVSFADSHPTEASSPSLYERIKNPLANVHTINQLIKTILVGVIKIGIPLVALAIMYSGFLFVTARGAPNKLEDAKRALLYTLLGAVLLLGAWAFAQLITDTVLAL